MIALPIGPNSPISFRHFSSFALIFFLSTGLGCDDNVVDQVLDEAPQICKDLCETQYDCEWSAAKELDDAREYMEDDCVFTCAFHAQEGALFIERSQTCADELEDGNQCVKTQESEKPAARVSGSKVQEYLDCLWSAGLFLCEEKSFGLHIDNAPACTSYNSCIAGLGFPLFENATWDKESGTCEVAMQFQGTKSYYLDLLF